MMKRILMTLFMFHYFTSWCFLSFPITDTLVLKQDTLQVETVSEYHQRMSAMGFDISNCLRDDCRKFKGVKKVKSGNQSNNQGVTIINWLFSIGIVILVISAVTLVYFINIIAKEVGGWT